MILKNQNRKNLNQMHILQYQYSKYLYRMGANVCLLDKYDVIANIINQCTIDLLHFLPYTSDSRCWVRISNPES